MIPPVQPEPAKPARKPTARQVDAAIRALAAAESKLKMAHLGNAPQAQVDRVPAFEAALATLTPAPAKRKPAAKKAAAAKPPANRLAELRAEHGGDEDAVSAALAAEVAERGAAARAKHEAFEALTPDAQARIITTTRELPQGDRALALEQRLGQLDEQAGSRRAERAVLSEELAAVQSAPVPSVIPAGQDMSDASPAPSAQTTLTRRRPKSRTKALEKAELKLAQVITAHGHGNASDEALANARAKVESLTPEPMEPAQVNPDIVEPEAEPEAVHAEPDDDVPSVKPAGHAIPDSEEPMSTVHIAAPSLEDSAEAYWAESDDPRLRASAPTPPVFVAPVEHVKAGSVEDAADSYWAESDDPNLRTSAPAPSVIGAGQRAVPDATPTTVPSTTPWASVPVSTQPPAAPRVQVPPVQAKPDEGVPSVKRAVQRVAPISEPLPPHVDPDAYDTAVTSFQEAVVAQRAAGVSHTDILRQLHEAKVGLDPESPTALALADTWTRHLLSGTH